MALEIEAKLRVASHEAVRQRLRQLNALFLGAVTEYNCIFDRPDGSLLAAGCGLRVRSALPLDDAQAADAGSTPAPPLPAPLKREESGRAPAAVSKATLTFKGPVRAGAVKSREEIEIEVDDADTAARLLERLGFVPVLTYEKRRESWEYGGCRIELDEPPRIGLFIEIEGPDEPSIRAVQTALGLQSVPHEPASYVQLLTTYCDTQGITNRTLQLT